MFRSDLTEMMVEQANISYSVMRAVRGLHYTDTVEGQDKYVTCVRGTFLDFVFDLRVGSPTYGIGAEFLLSADHASALHIPAGVGHATCCVDDDGATLLYLTSRIYDPSREYAICPTDPALGWCVGFGESELILSERDRCAPTLAQAREAYSLPKYQRPDDNGFPYITRALGSCVLS